MRKPMRSRDATSSAATGKRRRGPDPRRNDPNEIPLLDSWIEAMKPPRHTNLLSLPEQATQRVGRLPGGGFSAYAGAKLFSQLPISRKTKEALEESGYTEMSEIQRASLPHALCGRDVLGAAKTGSGKTLAFLVPIIEKLYRAQWCPEFGVGSIILSPTKELAGQLFEELQKVGKFHNFSAGLLVGGRKDLDSEKQRVNGLNILVCTPGRLLQHMNETPNFDCSELQVLVLDEADRILDHGFKAEVDAIISQLPKIRHTMLFSATQTKSVKDLARVSLKDPEYISVHEESKMATPERLMQVAMVVPREKKLSMLWSFIRRHLKSKILVFFTTCKQVRFVYEVFRKLRPGIPLKCLHGRMKLNLRLAVISEFHETTSVLFSTDVAARGLDIRAVDWVVQVDCPEDVATYIHRVGRTGRWRSEGRSLLFVSPEEQAMLKRLKSVDTKIPIKIMKANENEFEEISGRIASVLVQYPTMQQLAQRAFVTYFKSIHKQKDKEVFDVTKVPPEKFDAFAASLGLPVTPNVRFGNFKIKSSNKDVKRIDNKGDNAALRTDVTSRKTNGIFDLALDDSDDDVLIQKESNVDAAPEQTKELATRVLKKKKLKINIHRPSGTKLMFGEDGNPIAPLAAIADEDDQHASFCQDKVDEHFERIRVEVKLHDKEDMKLQREKRREKRMKPKRKRDQDEDEQSDASSAESYSDSDGADDIGSPAAPLDADRKALAEQEDMALKILSSMHS